MSMKQLVEGFSAQMRHAIEIGRSADLNLKDKKYQNVVIAGLGGSGIGGNLIQAVLSSKLAVPVIVNKTYNIPAFVNENTLFIASSFSGNTEETLSGIKSALAKNAAVVCVTSGGQLLKIAEENQLPKILIPGESKSPRACIGYSAGQLFFILKEAGLIDESFINDLDETVTVIESNTDALKQEAKQLAEAFFNRLPVVYADALFEPVAIRFQQQVNENSKQLCHVNAFPEMNHNELVGWENPEKILKDSVVLFLRSSYNHDRVNLRMDLCKPIFEAKANQVLNLEAKGTSLIAQAFYLIHLLDWVSVYLAELNGVDPFPVKVIDYLKSQLS